MAERDSHKIQLAFLLRIIGFRRKLRLLQSPLLKKLTISRSHKSVFVACAWCPGLLKNAKLQLLSLSTRLLFVSLFALFNALPPEVN